MTFLNQVALIIKSCFHDGISSVSAKGRKLERQTVLLRFCQERIQTTEGLCKIVLLLILGVISFLMVEQLINIFFLFTIAVYVVLSEGEFKNRLYQRNASLSWRFVLYVWFCFLEEKFRWSILYSSFFLCRVTKKWKSFLLLLRKLYNCVEYGVHTFPCVC